MSSTYTRALTFRSNNLGNDATFVLTFDEPVPGLYQEKFPVIWKTPRFSASGSFSVSITFSNQLGFLKAEVPPYSDVIEGSVYQSLKPSERTTLVEDSGRLSFTPPVPGSGGSYEAVNGTSQNAGVALAFFEDDSRPHTPVLYWNPDAFRPSGSIQAQFSPVLRAYITSAYQEQQIIKGEIPAPLIFRQDLSTLAYHTVWDLHYNPNTGAFSMDPVG